MDTVRTWEGTCPCGPDTYAMHADPTMEGWHDTSFTVPCPPCGQDMIMVLSASPITCQWYLLCDNPATRLMPHPILTHVPTCDRCADKIARIAAL